MTNLFVWEIDKYYVHVATLALLQCYEVKKSIPAFIKKRTSKTRHSETSTKTDFGFELCTKFWADRRWNHGPTDRSFYREKKRPVATTNEAY